MTSFTAASLDEAWMTTSVLGAAIGVGVCGLLYFLHRLRLSGAFQVLLFDWKEVPHDRVLMFKRFKGNYSEISGNYDRVMKLTEGYPCPSEGWGIYFDDPAVAGADNCRYSIGVVLAGKKTEKLETILAEQGFIKIEKVPANMQGLHLTFPFTGMLSVLVCVFRVYSAFETECKRLGIDTKNSKAKDGPMIEITRGREGVTEIYFVPDPDSCGDLMLTRM